MLFLQVKASFIPGRLNLWNDKRKTGLRWSKSVFLLFTLCQSENWPLSSYLWFMISNNIIIKKTKAQSIMCVKDIFLDHWLTFSFLCFPINSDEVWVTKQRTANITPYCGLNFWASMRYAPNPPIKNVEKNKTFDKIIFLSISTSAYNMYNKKH